MDGSSGGKFVLVGVLDFEKPFSDGCAHRPVLFYGGYWVEERMGSADDEFVRGAAGFCTG